MAASAAQLAPTDTDSRVRGFSVSRLLFGFGLAVVTMSLYSGVSHLPFLNYDDNWYVVQNAHIRTGITWTTLKWALTATTLSNWHPLTWISHAADYQFFGLNPAGHHYMNLLFHTANVLLLFLVLARATGKNIRSFIVALLFAIHPVNVESVAWIAERKNVLSMLFFLLALLAYGWYAKKPCLARYGVVFVLFALALSAKPQVVTLPFVLLLWDYWPLRRLRTISEIPGSAPRVERFSRLVAEKVPLFALSAASCIITLKTQTEAFGYTQPLHMRLGSSILAYISYMREAVWPARLSPMYPYSSFLNGWAVSGALLMLAVLTIVVVLAREKPYLSVGWFWFLGTLVPMIGLVQVGLQARADRYAYIPFIGLFLLVIWTAADFTEQAPRRTAVALSLGALAVVSLGFVTYRQLGYWSDNVRLWSHAIDVTQNNFIAEDSVGDALVRQGRSEDAIVHFKNAVTINPYDPVANLNIAAHDQQQGRFLEATARYQQVLRLTPNHQLLATALSNLGYCYIELHDDSSAQKSFESALVHDPETPAALFGLGVEAHRRSQFRQAIAYYSRAATLQPNAVLYVLLSRAMEQSGDDEQAKAAMAAASRLTPFAKQAEQSADRLIPVSR